MNRTESSLSVLSGAVPPIPPVPVGRPGEFAYLCRITLENTTPGRIASLVEKQCAFFAAGETRGLRFRKEMLARFDAGLRKWEIALCEALWQDLHKSYEEAFMTELGLVYGDPEAVALCTRGVAGAAAIRRGHLPGGICGTRPGQPDRKRGTLLPAASTCPSGTCRTGSSG